MPFFIACKDKYGFARYCCRDAGVLVLVMRKTADCRLPANEFETIEEANLTLARLKGYPQRCDYTDWEIREGATLAEAVTVWPSVAVFDTETKKPPTPSEVQALLMERVREITASQRSTRPSEELRERLSRFFPSITCKDVEQVHKDIFGTEINMNNNTSILSTLLSNPKAKAFASDAETATAIAAAGNAVDLVIKAVKAAPSFPYRDAALLLLDTQPGKAALGLALGAAQLFVPQWQGRRGSFLGRGLRVYGLTPFISGAMGAVINGVLSAFSSVADALPALTEGDEDVPGEDESK